MNLMHPKSFAVFCSAFMTTKTNRKVCESLLAMASYLKTSKAGKTVRNWHCQTLFTVRVKVIMWTEFKGSSNCPKVFQRKNKYKSVHICLSHQPFHKEDHVTVTHCNIATVCVFSIFTQQLCHIPIVTRPCVALVCRFLLFPSSPVCRFNSSPLLLQWVVAAYTCEQLPAVQVPWCSLKSRTGDTERRSLGRVLRFPKRWRNSVDGPRFWLSLLWKPWSLFLFLTNKPLHPPIFLPSFSSSSYVVLCPSSPGQQPEA